MGLIIGIQPYAIVGAGCTVYIQLLPLYHYWTPYTPPKSFPRMAIPVAPLNYTKLI